MELILFPTQISLTGFQATQSSATSEGLQATSLRNKSKTKSESSDILVQPELKKTCRADQWFLSESLTEGVVTNTRKAALLGTEHGQN